MSYIDYSRLKLRCPDCDSFRVEKTEIFKMALDKRGIKKEMRKCICKECGNEFWK